MGAFVDVDLWGMEDGCVGPVENGGNLKLSVYVVFTTFSVLVYYIVYSIYPIFIHVCKSKYNSSTLHLTMTHTT